MRPSTSPLNNFEPHDGVQFSKIISFEKKLFYMDFSAQKCTCSKIQKFELGPLKSRDFL